LLKVVSWNVNSINVRKDQALRFLEEKQPDFLLLQETKVEHFPKEPFQRLGYKVYHAGGKGRNGVAILSKEEADEAVIGFGDLFQDVQAKERLIGCRFKDLYVFSVYVPNGAPVESDYYYYKLEFFYHLREYLEKNLFPQDKIILGGDFNVAIEPQDVYDPLLFEGQICFTERERKAMSYLLDWGLIDTFRLLYPDKKGLFTWWDYQFSAFKKNLGMRLDYILATKPLAQHLKECEVDLKTRGLLKPSDHAPILAMFDL